MELAIIRQALKRAAESGSHASLAEALGFAPVEHPIDFLSDTSSEATERLRPLTKSLSRVGGFESGRAHAGLWVAMLSEWGDRNTTRERARRRLAKSLVELAPAGDRSALLILTAEGVDDIEIVLPRRRSNGSLGTVRALVSRSDPTRHHLELLESLVLKPGDETVAITRRWSDAFNVERVTKSFYLEFRALRDRLVETLKNENPGNALISPADDDDVGQSDLRRYVTRNLGRMLFLWFIQSKRWLDGDACYLLNLYNTRCRAGRNHNFFRESLIPLFFDALAKKPDDRPKAARSLGRLPYLNGGLFIQTAFEDRLYGDDREHIDVMIPNSLFDARVHDTETPTVLGLLSSYRFTTRESTPDDQSVDPDPELLGKVFENLNEDRRKTGTYYTPREVVRFMCREALDGYLRDVTGVTDETLEALRLEALDPAATDIHLSVEERKRLDEALLGVKVCDPAVGSGAFPVGMLQEIIQLLIGIEQSADVAVSVGGQRVAEWKEQIITNCLYGVDINPEAVEICHLRLWLSMVIDADRPVPLPNLDFRFEAGDTLVDRIGELPLLDSLPPEKQSILALGAVADALHDLEALRKEYALADDPAEARRLRGAVKEAQLRAIRIQVDELIGQCKDAIKGRNTRLAELQALNAGITELRVTQRQAESIGEKIEILEQFRDHLSPNAPYKKPFLWPVEFPEIFEAGGFNIVVANPPYVRGALVDPIDEAAFNRSYKDLIETGRSDLLLFFFGRAMQICRPSGLIAFITSNKWMSAKYGKRLRELLISIKPQYLLDFGDLPLFDAAAYPVVTVFRNGDSRNQSSSWLDVSKILRSRAAAEGAAISVSWVRQQLEELVELISSHASTGFLKLGSGGAVTGANESVNALAGKLEKVGPRLDSVFVVRRGLISGANDIFVIGESEALKWLAAEPKMAAFLRPMARGCDLSRWRVPAHLDYILMLGREFRMDSAPSELAKYLKKNRSRLEMRSTVVSGAHPWYQLTQPQVGYISAFSRPKIIWADISAEPTVSLDQDGICVDSTCYFLEATDPAILAWLNSTAVRFLMSLRGSSVRGNYQRWKSQWVGQLPLPRQGSPLHARLSTIGKDGLRGKCSSEQLDRAVFNAIGISTRDEEVMRQWLS